VKRKLDSLKSGAARNQFNAGALAECTELTEEALNDVRSMSYLLYPPLLEELGLKSAVPWYLDGFTRRSGIKTTLQMDPDFGRIAPHLEVVLFRVLQESLTNVHRHSGSSAATIRLVSENGAVTLQISGEGSAIRPEGLDCPGQDCPRQDWIGSRGVGLRGMNERICQLGGRLEVCSREGGTTITATVPISLVDTEQPPQK
jgi:signal transduction histidine kinase